MHERALRYLLAVVKAGSIRRAAEELHVAPSAVSRQISDLEQHYRVSLLERLTRGVVATEAGRIVVEHARRLHENSEEMEDRLRRLRGIKEGTVRISCGSGWEADLMENALLPFASDHPSIGLKVTTGTTQSIQALVANADADIGLLYNPPAHDGVVSRVVRPQATLAFVSPLSRYCSARHARPLREMADVPAAVQTPDHGLRQLLSRIEADQNFRLNVHLESDSSDLRRRFAVAGLGMAVIPAFSVFLDVRRGRLVPIRLLDPLLLEGAAHLIVRSGRRLPEAVEQMVRYLETRLEAFRPEAPERDVST